MCIMKNTAPPAGIFNDTRGYFLLAEQNGKHAGGRPMKFATVKELERKIKAYFKYCDPHIETVKVLQQPLVKNEKGRMVEDMDAEPIVVKKKRVSEPRPYTITGLALFLGTTRQTLLDYEERDEFSDTIKAAKLKIESFAEERLYSNKGSVAGTIFSLSNNFGWKNKVEQENSGESKLVIETRHHADEETDDDN